MPTNVGATLVPEDVVETEEVAVTEQPAPPQRPTVEEFKQVVRKHCAYYGFKTVEELCIPQTKELIELLAGYYGA